MKSGFYGSNLLEETKCFMYTNCLIDMATPLFELFKIKDDKEASVHLIIITYYYKSQDIRLILDLYF